MSKYDVSKFRNVTVALNTPFKKYGSVDIDKSSVQIFP